MMRKGVFILFFLLPLGLSYAQEIKWMSMGEALEAQQKEPRKIFMDAYTTWCGPCKLLDERTFSNVDVISYINKNYYAVKFNAEGNEKITYKEFTYTNPNYDSSRKGRNTQHQFAASMGITGYPSLVFFDERGEFIAPIKGYKTPQQLEVYLKMFARDDHKKITSNEEWMEYEKNFRLEFSN